MFKKISMGGLLVVFLFCFSFPAQALDFKKIEPTSNLLLPIRPITEPEPDRAMATSTVISPDESTAPESELKPVTDDYSSETAGSLFIDKTSDSDSQEKEPAPTDSVGSLPVASSPTVNIQTEPAIVTATEDLKRTEDTDKPALIAEIDFSQVDVGASLDVCNIGPSCSGDVGKTHWLREANVNPNDMKRGLRFNLNNPDLKNGILQVSYFPFTENENPNLVYSKGVTTGESIFDFNVLADSSAGQLQVGTALVEELSRLSLNKPTAEIRIAPKTALGKFIAKIKNIITAPFRWVKNLVWKPAPEMSMVQANFSDSLKIQHNTYYLRVVPTRNSQVAGKASNEVKVTLNEPSETNVTWYSPAKIYEIKIKDFQPIRAPEPGVCTGAVILDTDYVINNQIIKRAGEIICPATYQGEGEEAWYESLWNAAKSGVDWVSAAYNALKSALVDAVAGLACGGDDVCKMAISAGLDIGLAAMGVPPSIPNFDALVDGGFDYLASEISAQAGCPDAVCKQMVKDKLREVLDQSKNTNPSCKGEEEAHRMGIEPLCLPANVKGHLDPRGTYRDAQVTLEVRRNQVDGSGLAGAPYKLYFNNIVYNAGPVGSKIVNIEPYGESVQITEPLQSKAFESKMIVIPSMEKGETFEIPLVLTPVEYWVPGHKEAMHGWSTVVYKDGWPQYQYDDWWKLYYGGTLTLGAAIDGCEYSYGQADCIVSADNLTVGLPNTLNP